jgi:hypothetical protein
MVLSKLISRTVKKNLKSDDKFGHGNGNWSKTKDLL